MKSTTDIHGVTTPWRLFEGYHPLEGAYDEINQLETTTIELGDYYEYKEAFVPWAIVGVLLIMGSITSRRLWFEPVP